MVKADMAIPALEGVDEQTRQDIRDWYESHKFTYAKVWDRLDQVRMKWALLDKNERRAFVKMSYVWTLFTQLTATHIAEESFERLMAGMSVHDARSTPVGGKKPGKENQMQRWIHTSFTRDHWDEVVDLLDDQKVDTAHQLLVDQSLGLRPTKAAFVLANLGFVHKMCVDSNVGALVGAHHPDPEKELKAPTPSTKVVQKYDEFCGDIQDMFPELSDVLEPYHLQWLLFDFQRFHKKGRGKSVGVTEDMAVATHDVWFDYALGDINHVRARMGTITRRAKLSQMGEEIDETVAEAEALGREEEALADIEQAIREAEESA